MATNSGPRYYTYAPGPAVGENAGEPSIGYNPSSGRAIYIAGLQTLRVTFPEKFTPLGQTPIVRAKLSAGPHTLVLTNTERGLSTTYQITIEPGKTSVRRLGLD